MSKYLFIRVKISILMLKIAFGHPEAAGGCQRPARYSNNIGAHTYMPSCMSKYRFIKERIEIMTLNKPIFRHRSSHISV